MLSRALLLGSLCLGLANALPSLSQLPHRRGPTLKRASVCDGNSADDRSTWCDYSIDTNYYDEAPDTGVTVEYWLELTNITASPDGVDRIVQAVNGSIPGPTIEANWCVHIDSLLTDV
jgi:hypothetical protein